MIRILKYGEVANDEIFARTESAVNVEGVVADIIADVRKNGDAALYKYCEKFDGANIKEILSRHFPCRERPCRKVQES